MALSQIQIIQSLGKAMSWFERELAWGVPATELRHLTGRIGELYAALITNGQMASRVNEKGYDVVSETGDRISVKTTGMMSSSGQVSFNPNTLDIVDRVIILRVNTEEMQIEKLLDEPIKKAKALMTEVNANGKRSIALSKLITTSARRSDIAKVASVSFRNYTINALENGTIEVFEAGNLVPSAISVLRKVAQEIGISTINSNGNPHNTRQLGSHVITAIQNQ